MSQDMEDAADYTAMLVDDALLQSSQASDFTFPSPAPTTGSGVVSSHSSQELEVMTDLQAWKLDAFQNSDLQDRFRTRLVTCNRKGSRLSIGVAISRVPIQRAGAFSRL